MSAKKTRKAASSKKARTASKPSALAVVRGVKRELSKRGVTVDARGRAKRNGKALSLSSLRRTVAAVKRAIAPPKKKTATRRMPARPARAIAKTRAAAKPQKRVAPKKPIAKKPSRAIARASQSARKQPARALPKAPPKKPARALPKAPPKKPARARGPSPAQVRAQKKAAAQLARARAERSRLQKQLKAQAAREKALAAEQRRTRRELAAMRKQLDALTKREEQAERRVAALPPAPPETFVEKEAAIAPPPPPPPARTLTAEEQLAKDIEEEEAAKAAERPRPKTPFDVLIESAAAKLQRGEQLSDAEKRELALAAAIQAGAPTAPAAAAAAGATDNDYAIAEGYMNLSPHEQQSWARMVDATGKARISDAARALIRERIFDKAIAARSNKRVIDMRKSPIFADDELLKELARALGPLVDPDRRVLSNKDIREMLVEHLRTQDKWEKYRDEINQYFDHVRPASDLIQAAYDDEERRRGHALSDQERRDILERLLPELRKKYPGLSERELWTMAKSPDAVAVVV